MIGKDFLTEPSLAPKNVSLLSLLSANDWQGFPNRAGPCYKKTCLSCLSCPPMIGKDFLTEPGLAPKNVSLLSLLSANDWQGFPNRAEPCSKKRVFPVSPVRQ
jgi:hypothetical protein